MQLAAVRIDLCLDEFADRLQIPGIDKVFDHHITVPLKSSPDFLIFHSPISSCGCCTINARATSRVTDVSANTVARLQVLAGEMAEDFQDITLRDLRLRCVEVDEVWSFAERNNLTMRMGMRRFTRRTNAFSKRFRNHALAVVLHFMHYNFCRVHQTIETTPAIKAGVADIGSGRFAISLIASRRWSRSRTARRGTGSGIGLCRDRVDQGLAELVRGILPAQVVTASRLHCCR